MPALSQAKPIVAIVGRPNVGKSTLFNRLAGRRIAIVEETPGVTRDRLYCDCEWYGHPFVLIDTGGIQSRFHRDAPYAAEIRDQVAFALAEAAVIIFLVDGKEGLTPDDEDVADILRRAGKPIVLTVNKVESLGRTWDAAEFYALGFGQPVTVSALHGQDVDILLDTVCDQLPPPPEPIVEEERLRMAIVGRPNVGKSSLLNAILNQQRAIVSEEAGTTRDAVDIAYDWEGTPFLLTDTAGIRRKSKVEADVEYYSVVRAFSAIDRCDVAVLVIDGLEGVTDQDKRIAGYADESGRALVIAVNKWDAVLNRSRVDEGLNDGGQLDSRQRKLLIEDFTRDARHELIFCNYAPVVFISALKRRSIPELLTTVQEVAEQHAMRVPTAELNKVLAEAAFEHPTSRRGKQVKIYYGTQPSVKPPTFVLFVNEPEMLHFSAKRYLENRIRERFSLEGTPIRLVVRQSGSRDEAEGGQRPTRKQRIARRERED